MTRNRDNEGKAREREQMRVKRVERGRVISIGRERRQRKEQRQ